MLEHFLALAQQTVGHRSMVDVDRDPYGVLGDVQLAFGLVIAVVGIVAIAHSYRSGKAGREKPLMLSVVAVLGILGFLLGILVSVRSVVQVISNAKIDTWSRAHVCNEIAVSLVPVGFGTAQAMLAAVFYLVCLIVYNRARRSPPTNDAQVAGDEPSSSDAPSEKEP